MCVMKDMPRTREARYMSAVSLICACLSYMYNTYIHMYIYTHIYYIHAYIRYLFVDTARVSWLSLSVRLPSPSRYVNNHVSAMRWKTIMIIAIGGAYQCTKYNERVLYILTIRAPNLPPAVTAIPIKGADLFINHPSPPPFPLFGSIVQH